MTNIQIPLCFWRSGHHFTVSAGRTLLLPCSSSSKHRLRWFHRREGGRRELIFTWFRNGTMKPEREGSRLGYENDALQIQDLQLEDAGQYQCNGKVWTRVTVLTGELILIHSGENTSIWSTMDFYALIFHPCCSALLTLFCIYCFHELNIIIMN